MTAATATATYRTPSRRFHSDWSTTAKHTQTPIATTVRCLAVMYVATKGALLRSHQHGPKKQSKLHDVGGLPDSPRTASRAIHTIDIEMIAHATTKMNRRL